MGGEKNNKNKPHQTIKEENQPSRGGGENHTTKKTTIQYNKTTNPIKKKKTNQEWQRKEMNEKIAELRKYLNLSLVAFSKPLGCSPTQVKRMEVGTVVPSEEDIKKICAAFGVDEERVPRVRYQKRQMKVY